jgi:hypothetical protein
MTIQRSSGPFVIVGLNGAIGTPTGLTGVAGPPPYVSGVTENQDAGPSPIFGATLLRDFRMPPRDGGIGLSQVAGTGIGYPAQEFGYAAHCLQTIDAQPLAAAATNIANAVTLVANTPFTALVAGTGCTRLTAPYYVPGFANVIPAGSILVDAQPTYYGNGSSDAIQTWTGNSPGRVLASGAFTGTITIRGFDVYGFPLTASLTNPIAATPTLKAFKWVTSITGSAGGAYSLGTADSFEFPLRCDRFVDTIIYWNNALITAATGFTAANTTVPNTAVLGSTRGLYAVQSASDGTKQLIVRQFVRPLNLDNQNGSFGIAMV